jgi:hypothetical protein
MEYLKKAEPIGEQVAQDTRESVSEILMAVERTGIRALGRNYTFTRAYPSTAEAQRKTKRSWHF